MGLGRTGLRNQCRTGVVLGEDAVEDLAAVLFEVVVAHPAREIEARRRAQRRFAEGATLVQRVVEIRPEQVILRGPQSLGKAVWRAKDRRGECVKSADKEILSIVTLVMAVESADQPPQAARGSRQAHFLCKYMRLRRIVEGSIERIDVLRQADRPAGDAPGECSRITYDENVAARVGGNARQADVAEVIAQVHITQHELVRERFGDLREELILPERDRRPGGRERIGEDVEHVVPVPAILLHLLIEHSGRNAEVAARRDAVYESGAGATPTVHVLVELQVRLHRVHPAAGAIAVADDAQRGLVADGDVESHLRAVPSVAALDEVDAGLSERAARAQLRLIADVADRARQRAGAEERTLRAAQHLDPAHVEEIEVGREQRE